MRPKSYQSPGHDDERAFSAQLQTLIGWDYSDLPTTNQPFKKLGAQQSLRMAAMEAWGEDSKLSKIADGTSRPGESSGRKFNTIFNFDPNSLVLRLHQADGKGDLSCWAIRLTVDQTNPHSSRENHGTMVVDFEGSQAWGWTNDFWRLTGIAAAVADKELAFNGAAYLGMLYPDGKGGGIPAHNALAQEISLNLGFVATAKKVAQWPHILTFIDPPADKGAGKTQTAKAKTKAGGRPDKKAELALLHRTPFKLPDGSAVTMPQIEAGVATSPDGSKKYKVHFTKGAKNPQRPDLDENKLSNFKPIEVSDHEMLDGYVAIDPMPYKPYETGDHSSHDETHHDYSYHGTPTGGNGGSSGGSPEASGGTYSGDSGLGQGNTGSPAPAPNAANPGGDTGFLQQDGTLTRPGPDGTQQIRDPDTGVWNDKFDTNGNKIPN